MTGGTPSGAMGEAFEGVLRAARQGAEWAWTRIYDSLAPPLLGYLRARGAPDPEAVAGEVFVQLVRDIRRFSGDEAGFRSWVFAMAHHRLLDDLRRRRRRPETAVDPQSLLEIEDEAGVEAQVVGRVARDELEHVLAALTPPQREVILLRVFGGLSLKEVARAMGRRVGAVKALQHRAIETLRAMLEAYPSDEEGR